jgi:hypothetical protein
MVISSGGFVASYPSFTQEPLRFEFGTDQSVLEVAPVAVRHGFIAVVGTVSVSIEDKSAVDGFVQILDELTMSKKLPTVQRLNLNGGGHATKVAIDDKANAWIVGTSAGSLFVSKFNIAQSKIEFTNYYGDVFNSDRGSDIILNEYMSNGQTDVFVTGYTDKDQLVVVRIDAVDGKVAWQTQINNAMGHTLQIVRDTVIVVGKKLVYLDNAGRRNWVLAVFNLDYASGKVYYESCVEKVELTQTSSVISVRIGEDIVVGHDIVAYEGHGHTDMLLSIMSSRGFADYCRESPISINQLPGKLTSEQRTLSIVLPIVFVLLLAAAIIGAVKWDRYRKDKFRILEEIDNAGGANGKNATRSKIELGDMGDEEEDADEATALSARNKTHSNAPPV